MRTISDDFTTDLQPHWTITTIGAGTCHTVNEHLRMSLGATAEGVYADAQIDDYGKLPRAQFPWRPPLRMIVRARTSHPGTPTDSSGGQLSGTAGFGFWNYPFSVRGDILMLPEAIWFFYASPPSNMALVPGTPGWGWKAQVVHAMRPGALLATVPTALTMAWARLARNEQPAARWLQRLSGAREQVIATDMTIWHTYMLEWLRTEARFWVDGELVLQVTRPPTRPLGFVAWLDNQYAIVTPRGQLQFGAVSCGEQWLELDRVKIEPIA